VAVYDVIAMVKGCDQDYACKCYTRLVNAGKVPEFEEVGQELVRTGCPDQDTSHWGGNRKPVRVATADEMIQILMQLPGNEVFKKNCASVVARFLGGDYSLMQGVAANRAAQEQLARDNPDHPMRICGDDVETRGQTQSLQDTIASAVENGFRQGLKNLNERFDAIEAHLRNVPEYGPRIEISRGFPVAPNELTNIGVKLDANEDMRRWDEFGLPTSTFLQEKLPDKQVARINACFAKVLKKRRLELDHNNAEENQIFLIYNQGAWRIAYFEDDRELMEKVLAEPAMKETIKRHFPNQPNKRHATLDDFKRPRNGATGSSSSASSGNWGRQ
jgi:hypothetical protein